MRRYLIVAHRTLGGANLQRAVEQRLASGPCRFTVVVPARPPLDHTYSKGEAEARAQEQLDEALARFRALGATVDGEVGDQDPVYAATTLLRRGETFDEILLSTLHPHVSRWLRLDATSRLRKESPVPVTHIVGERHPAAAPRRVA